jgi:hypothetical protein
VRALLGVEPAAGVAHGHRRGRARQEGRTQHRRLLAI